MAPTTLALGALKVACDPVRFALLGHAAAEGGLREARAAEIVGDDPANGTVRTVHARALSAAGLLTRLEHPVRYEITPDGRAVHAALSAALETLSDVSAIPDQVAVLMLVDRRAYDEILEAGGTGGDLMLALGSRLRAATSSQIAFRVSRLER